MQSTLKDLQLLSSKNTKIEELIKFIQIRIEEKQAMEHTVVESLFSEFAKNEGKKINQNEADATVDEVRLELKVLLKSSNNKVIL